MPSNFESVNKFEIVISYMDHFVLGVLSGYLFLHCLTVKKENAESLSSLHGLDEIEAHFLIKTIQ